jgi:hypothetical protein
MKRIKLTITYLLVIAVSIAGCSKNDSDKLIGKWSVDSLSDPGRPAFNVDVTYEFTKDKLIMEGNIHGQQLPTVEAPYVIKSNVGGLLILEATHPETKQKGEFKIKIDGNKMVLTDPNERIYHLTKK